MKKNLIIIFFSSLILNAGICLAAPDDTLMSHKTDDISASAAAVNPTDAPGGVNPVAESGPAPAGAAPAVMTAPVATEEIPEDRREAAETEDAGDSGKETESEESRETREDSDRDESETDEQTDQDADEKEQTQARIPRFAMTYGADMEKVDAPAIITWLLRIENTGDAPLTGIAISSRVPKSFSGPKGDADQAGVLDVGEIWTFTGEFAVVQKIIDGNGVDPDNMVDGNGYIDSVVTVAFAETEPQKTAESVQVVQNTGFTVTQTPDIALIDEPATITYHIAIENTGNVSLTGITITAPLLGKLDGPDGDAKNPGILDVNEIWTYTGTYKADRNVIEGAGVNTYNVMDNSGAIDSIVLVSFAETDLPQTAHAAVTTKLAVTGDIFEKKYRNLHAFISVKRAYTTNLYRTDNNEQSCWSTSITPGIWATYPANMARSVEIVTANASPGGLAIDTFNPVDFRRFQAYLLYSPQFDRYHGQKNRGVRDPDAGAGIIDDDDIDQADDYITDLLGKDSLNRTIHRVDAMLHYHSGNKLAMRAIDQYKISYDPFSERTYFISDKYRSNMFNVAGTLDATKRLQLRLDYGNFNLNYRDRFNRDDNRADDVYAAYLFFRFTEKISLFVEYDFADINYKTSLRDSHEHRYFGGLRWEITGKSSGQIKGGFGRKKMDDSPMIDTDVSISDISSSNWLAAVQFDHNFTPRTNLTLNAYRRYDEVLEHRYNYGNLEKFYADYILTHFGGFKLSWNAFPELIFCWPDVWEIKTPVTFRLDASLFHDRFKGSRLMDRDGKPAERKDLDFAVSPSVSVDLFNHFSLNGGYIYTDHDSNYPTHDYVDHAFFIRASLFI